MTGSEIVLKWCKDFFKQNGKDPSPYEIRCQLEMAVDLDKSNESQLKAQRDELLEAVTIISNRFTLTAELTQQNREVIRIARKAIDNCK